MRDQIFDLEQVFHGEKHHLRQVTFTDKKCLLRL